MIIGFSSYPQRKISFTIFKKAVIFEFCFIFLAVSHVRITSSAITAKCLIILRSFKI